MGKKFNNLVLQVVIEEIQNILDIYADSIYSTTLATAEVRQKLRIFVLNKLPETYTALDDDKNRSSQCKFPAKSLELRLQIENYIHQGIKLIILEKSNGASHLE
jgi:hypothetical protein